jgi:hypothetical protein
MVKNTSGGSKTKSFARKLASNSTQEHTRLPSCPLEHVAAIYKNLGFGKCMAHSLEHNNITAFIRNKFRGRGKHNNLISVGSIVLIGLREWEAPNFKTADILYVYSYDEVAVLRSLPQFNIPALDTYISQLITHTPQTTHDFEFSAEEQTSSSLGPIENTKISTNDTNDEKHEEIDFDDI